MGTGINAARDGAPEHAAMLDDFKDQLLLAIVRRSPDGKLSIPVSEVDATGGYVMLMSVDTNNQVFHFEVRPKQ